jgi:hypothetical protein
MLNRFRNLERIFPDPLGVDMVTYNLLEAEASSSSRAGVACWIG